MPKRRDTQPGETLGRAPEVCIATAPVHSRTTGTAGYKSIAASRFNLDILDDGFLHYQTGTLEGSSGSPVYSENRELVALHHAGIPEVKNGQIITTTGGVWTDDMSDDAIHWVANEGIRISAIIQALNAVQLPDSTQAAILHRLLLDTTGPADDISQLLTGARQAGESLAPHVYAPRTAVPETREASTVPADEKALRFDPAYDKREGYDEGFPGNGLTVPLPGVSPEREDEIYKQDGKALVLPYHHSSLVMNGTRRMQMC